MTWVLNNLELIGSRTLSHLLLAIPAIVASFVLALPLGWVANRYRWSRATLLTAAGLLYAIPAPNPAGTMPYGSPAASTASHTAAASAAGTTSSYPRSPV